MPVVWVSPSSGLRDEEKECGLKYSCLIPGDAIVNFQCVANVTAPEMGPVVFSVFASDTGNQPAYTDGTRLVGLGNLVGKYVSCNVAGLVSGTIGVFTSLQPDFPRGGLHDGNGGAIPITYTFTVRARDVITGSFADRTFSIIVYHCWSVDRDNFVVTSPLGQSHLDELQAAGYCNN